MQIVSLESEYKRLNDRIKELEQRNASLIEELSKLQSAATWIPVSEKIKDYLNDKDMESMYHTDLCSSILGADCLCGANRVQDICKELREILSDSDTAQMKEEG